MTIAGAAVLPSAPLLVPGIAASLADGVPAVCDAVDIVVERLPEHRGLLLLAAGPGWAVHGTADADLAPIGRADVVRKGQVDRALLDLLSGRLGWPVAEGPLPLDLAVLTLLLGTPAPLVALSVPSGESFDALASAGRRLGAAIAGEERGLVVVTTGDLAAGLEERSPLTVVEGAREFDACVVEAVDAGRLDRLERLGPERALEVGARSWAPLVALHGLLEGAKLGLVRRLYAAPRGVGYLVAHGA